MDGSQLSDEHPILFAGRLGASETERFANFIRPTRRRQFLLGRMLLRVAAAEVTGLSPEKICVLESPGKPPQLLFPDTQRLVPNHSLSHSGKWAACAISSQAILGVDIEVNSADRDFDSISEVAFGAEEQIWLASQSGEERVAAFYSLWCAREALFKLHCNLRHNAGVSPLLGDEAMSRFQSDNQHQYQLRVADLTVVICSDRQLSEIHQKKLTKFHRVAWTIPAANLNLP